MNSASKQSDSSESLRNPSSCLVHSLATVLATEPALEAVTINRRDRGISLATLGSRSHSGLEERVAAAVRDAEPPPGSKPCGLLEGESECTACQIPFAPYERQSLVIKRDADSTTIARASCPTAPRFWHWRRIPWPRIVSREMEIPEDDAPLNEWKMQLAMAIACGAMGLMAGFVFTGTAALICYAAAFLAGGWFAAAETWELLAERKLDVHFLMLAVAAGSAAIGAYAEGVTLLFLFSFSGGLEHYAMGRTQREIRSLFKAAPKTAILLGPDGNESEIAVANIETGMRLRIKPDTQFAVDAEIVQGSSSSDESNLTGESIPVNKSVGDNVLAGTLNLGGMLEVIVLRPANESALQKIIRLIREAQHLKAPSQRFTDKFGTGYTYAILSVSLIMFFVWWLGFHLPPFAEMAGQRSAFYRAMTLLVVASPCALVLSIPSAVLAAIAWGARRGILFRGGGAVENLSKISVVALDKTGTLTTGDLRVEKVESFPAGREREVTQLALSLDQHSRHPLARAICSFGKRQNLTALQPGSFESLPGLGVKGEINGQTVFLGRREWVLDNSRGDAGANVPVAESGLSEVWIASGQLSGRVLLRDDIRKQARGIIARLRSAGLRTIVLTGDRRGAAELLKKELELDDVRAELKPEQKVAVIQSLAADGIKVAMIGDGVNDAPSLAAAEVGVAMGARGSDAALEQAEVVLMNDRLENFWSAFQLSRRARKIIFQNLVISLGTVIVLVISAIASAIPLTIGVVGHEGSTVVVVINSLRLLWQREEPEKSQE